MTQPKSAVSSTWISAPDGQPPEGFWGGQENAPAQGLSLAGAGEKPLQRFSSSIVCTPSTRRLPRTQVG